MKKIKWRKIFKKILKNPFDKVSKYEWITIFVFAIIANWLYEAFLIEDEKLNNHQTLILEGSFFVGLTLFFYLLNKKGIAKKRKIAYEDICSIVKLIKLDLDILSKDGKKEINENTDNRQFKRIKSFCDQLSFVIQISSTELDSELLRRIKYFVFIIPDQKSSIEIKILKNLIDSIEKRMKEKNVDCDYYTFKLYEFINKILDIHIPFNVGKYSTKGYKIKKDN